MALLPRPGQKTVLITGCTPGGIGYSIAQAFHAKGLFVIATARRAEVLNELSAEGLATIALDVTKKESIAKCLEEVNKLTDGRLDILVNNAGRTHTVPATDLDMDEVRATYETNVFGLMAMCQTFIPLLIKTRGLIINVGSVSAVVPYCFGSSYCSSKGAVVSYSRTLRLELRPFGVRVTVVMAGTVRSNIANNVRDLPPGSIYAPINDLFRIRQRYSQTHSPMNTDEFARVLINVVLRPEAPLLLRSWFGIGRPDWFWYGGMSFPVWLGTVLGEWITDMVTWRVFRLKTLQDILEQKKKLT